MSITFNINILHVN